MCSWKNTCTYQLFMNVWHLLFAHTVVNKHAANEAWNFRTFPLTNKSTSGEKYNIGKTKGRVRQSRSTMGRFSGFFFRRNVRFFLREVGRELDLKCMCRYKSVCSSRQLQAPTSRDSSTQTEANVEVTQK